VTNTLKIFPTGEKDEVGHEYGSLIIFDANKRPVATGWVKFSIMNEKKRRGRPPEVGEKWKKFLICLWNIYADVSMKDSVVELEKKLGYKDNNGRSVKRIKKDMDKCIQPGSFILTGILTGTGEPHERESARIALIFDPIPILKQSTQGYTLEGIGWHWDSVGNVANYNNWQLEMTNPVNGVVAWDTVKNALNSAHNRYLAARKADGQ